MNETLYRVLPRKDRGYEVSFAVPNSLPRVASGFATEAEAKDWIAQDKRFADADDRWQQRTAHKWLED